ncbi:hypothetical protein L1280_000972 [Deinococcus sp. HSC-46F16]|uniref:hypothetical protein n=1 Tax=Deinococcus sp. HSC-46F16 TaxID=2910968 RepID=UPI00209FFEAC|nr:hypothetical protein [Deinococcus sp. HSC-46F16]MCP2013844.1 hypothetical protein [Deinococcus sp. HSC-46F16]
MDPAPGPDAPPPALPPSARRARRRRKEDPLGLLALLIPIFVLSQVFSRGNPLPGLAVLLLVALTLLLLFGNPRTGANLRAVFARPQAAGVLALLIPAVAVSGVFGGPWLMLAVLSLAFVGLGLAAFRGVDLIHEAGLTPAPPVSAVPQPAPAALAAQPSAEVLPQLDVRELCRGLPPALAGEVLSTVDHLETVAVQAREGGDTRRAFDARQSLGDYLPGTVQAWKAQPEDERDPAELGRALSQIRRIAGSDTSSRESARRAWDTQQRFLEARTEKETPGDGIITPSRARRRE